MASLHVFLFSFDLRGFSAQPRVLTLRQTSFSGWRQPSSAGGLLSSPRAGTPGAAQPTVSRALVLHTSRDRMPQVTEGLAPRRRQRVPLSPLARPRAACSPGCCTAPPPAFVGSRTEWRHNEESPSDAGAEPWPPLASSPASCPLSSHLLTLGSARGPRSSESPVSESTPSSSSPPAKSVSLRLQLSEPAAGPGAGQVSSGSPFPSRSFFGSSRRGISAPGVRGVGLAPSQPTLEGGLCQLLMLNPSVGS